MFKHGAFYYIHLKAILVLVVCFLFSEVYLLNAVFFFFSFFRIGISYYYSVFVDFFFPPPYVEPSGYRLQQIKLAGKVLGYCF